MKYQYLKKLSEVTIKDIAEVGGKNASLGEMISNLSHKGIMVPDGFATTSEAFQLYLAENELNKKIINKLEKLDVDDINELNKTGSEIRKLITDGVFPKELEKEIRESYLNLSLESQLDAISVAIRSSATAEDLPDASFAGQQESFLNVNGIESVLESIKKIYASLYNDRAISYRIHKHFKHEDVSISAGIQKMVRSDIGSSGVMFSVDTESGFDDVIFITSSYGLGETIVQGAVNPDEFYIYKPSLKANKKSIIRRLKGEKAVKMIYGHHGQGQVITLPVVESDRKQFSITDRDIITLSKYACIIEDHYKRAMDIEWGKDGEDGKLYILQARPETVISKEQKQILKRYKLEESGEVLADGRSVGQMIGQGKVKVIKDISEMNKVEKGDVIVADMTDPDWEPVMKRASAIVTNRGGRTCHAAIIARELGIPAVVGCINATEKIKDGTIVTVSCAEGDIGKIYHGKMAFSIDEIALEELPPIPVKLAMNVGSPSQAFSFSRIPNHGVGLARLEFIIARTIGLHPNAVLDYPNLPEKLVNKIQDITAGYVSPREFYVEKIAEGVSTIAAAFSPKPVIVRMSDFKSNEYRELLGGSIYEPEEENPMLGFRGVSRYLSGNFHDCFRMECEAILRVRNNIGLKNVMIMVPFIRTLEEAKLSIEVLAKNGLVREPGVKDGLKIIMMCEVPSNAILADQFLEFFDGFSIGSNDMTQLTLALDRDSSYVSHLFDERNPAVKALLSMAIKACKKQNKYIGICGQGPSDYLDFAEWLMEEGISTISLNPDSVLETWLRLGKINKKASHKQSKK